MEQKFDFAPNLSFTLNVQANLNKGGVNAIKFDLELNPNSAVFTEDHVVFEPKQFDAVLAHIKKLIGEIVEKAQNPKNKEDQLFKAGNKPVKLNTARIGRIVYGHSSPPAGVVSFLSSTNGDLKPPVR